MVVNIDEDSLPKPVKLKIFSDFEDDEVIRQKLQKSLYFNRKRRRGLAGIPVVDVPFNPPDSPNPKTSFDELYATEGTDPVQITWPYNVNPDQGRVQETNLGTVTQDKSQLVVQSGAAADSSAEYLSIRLLQFRPGQGIDVRSGCVFTQGAPGSEQVMGVGDDSNGFFFGYNGTEFSVLRRYEGDQEVRSLLIETPALVTGSITVSVLGFPLIVLVTAGQTAHEVASAIASAARLTLPGWRVDVNNDSVRFFAWVPEPKIGAITLTDTGGTGVSGVESTIVSGAIANSDWVPQSQWNRDKMDGTGPSKAILDPTKGNEYRIVSQALSYNNISYYIQNPLAGFNTLVHRIHYLNTSADPPIFRSGIPMKFASRNSTNTTNLTIKSTALSCFVQGNSNNFLPFKAADVIADTVTTTETPLISLKNNTVHQGIENRGSLRPAVLSISSADLQGVIFRLYVNATLLGTPDFQDVNPETSIASIDVAATGFTGGEFVFSLQLGNGGEEIVNLALIRGLLLPGIVLTVTTEAIGGNNLNAGVSVVWEEEQ